MNGTHWTDFSEAQLAAMKAGRTLHASRPGRSAHVQHRPHVPDVTAEAKAVLAGLPADDGPAYPAWWLPEVKAAQTPSDWMRENAPDPHTHRNGTAPSSIPADDAYPTEWLQGFGGLGGGALGGEGFLTDGGDS